MNGKGLQFDDFDLDIYSTNENLTDTSSLVSIASTDNSSTSFCCATATNVTEDGCSWCASCISIG